MKLVEMKCKNCGAVLKEDAEAKEVKCSFCNTIFKVDDEVQHHKFDDAEQTGYEFEKGKIRAREEAKQEKVIAQYNQEKKQNNLKWWIIGWIFFFPIPLTILIWRSKWDNKKKIIATAILWILLIIFGALSSLENESNKETRITECYSKETYNKLDELIGAENIDGNFTDSYSCQEIRLNNQYNKSIEIEMDGDDLVAIKLDGKYIYNIDSTVEIYDPTTMRVKKQTNNDSTIFLKNTNAKEYYKILCGVTGLSENNSKNVIGDINEYSSVNSNYMVEVGANKATDEIGYVTITTINAEDPTNAFMALTRLDYDGKEPAKLTTFIRDNKGKKGEITIGDIKFSIWNNSANKPVIEAKTIGFDKYVESLK